MQLADFHGHGFLYKAVWKKDSKGRLLDEKGAVVPDADLQGEVVIDVTMMFGGTTLVIPADWKVRSEVVCIFGGIDEKRSMIHPSMQMDKVLILKGTVIFGGIDIKSY